MVAEWEHEKTSGAGDKKNGPSKRKGGSRKKPLKQSERRKR